MAEKEIVQRQAAGAETEQVGGKEMRPPAFKLVDGGDGGGGGSNGGGSGNGGAGKALDGKAVTAEKELKQRGPNFKSHVSSNAIVTVPQNGSETLPIIVIVGGIDYATKEWMKTQVPASYFETHILVFANHNTSYRSAVKPEIEAALTKDKVKGTYKAMLGFSAGGNSIEASLKDETWSFLGMIDPMVHAGKTYPCPLYMVWYDWDKKYDARNKAIANLDQRINKGEVPGASVKNTKVGHSNMPKLWFQTYGGYL